MPGLLEGQLAKAIFQGFKGKLLKGTLRRDVVAESAGLDDLGDPNATDPQTFSGEGYVDSKVERFARVAGIPTLDGTVYFFGASLPTTPLKGDKAFMASQWWEVHAVQNDPATALWALGCTSIPAP